MSALDIKILSLPQDDRDRLKALVALVSRCSDFGDEPVEIVEIFRDIIRSRGGLRFELQPAAGTYDLQPRLQFSDALLNLCAALGARDIAGDLVSEVRHVAVSIGSVATSDVAHSVAQDLSRVPRVAFSSGGAA